MFKTLLKSTIEVRIETKDEVAKLHEEVNQMAHDYDATLTSWKEARKDIKDHGEIVETFYIVSYTLVFEENPKDPEGRPFSKEVYEFSQFLDKQEDELEESEEVPFDE